MQISHETISVGLCLQSDGTLHREGEGLLRRKRKFRQSRFTNNGGNRGQLIDAVSTSERQPEFENRAVPGHWDGDLITGSMNPRIAILIERQTRLFMPAQVEAKETRNVAEALIRQMTQLPKLLQRHEYRIENQN